MKIKENYKFIICILVSVLISSFTNAGAITSMFSSSSVSYETPSTMDPSYNTVKLAMDELYAAATDYSSINTRVTSLENTRSKTVKYTGNPYAMKVELDYNENGVGTLARPYIDWFWTKNGDSYRLAGRIEAGGFGYPDGTTGIGRLVLSAYDDAGAHNGQIIFRGNDVISSANTTTIQNTFKSTGTAQFTGTVNFTGTTSLGGTVNVPGNYLKINNENLYGVIRGGASNSVAEFNVQNGTYLIFAGHNSNPKLNAIMMVRGSNGVFCLSSDCSMFDLNNLTTTNQASENNRIDIHIEVTTGNPSYALWRIM